MRVLIFPFSVAVRINIPYVHITILLTLRNAFRFDERLLRLTKEKSKRKYTVCPKFKSRKL